MSARARNARRLASLLTADTNGLFVQVTYDQPRRCYVVKWSDGPNLFQMRRLAIRHADEVPLLEIDELLWLRAKPTDTRAIPVSLPPQCNYIWGSNCSTDMSDSHWCGKAKPCGGHVCECGATPVVEQGHPREA